MSELVILGRGPSVYATALPHGVDVMAVSSGIFVLGPDRPPRLFCTMDPPKYFILPCMGHSSIAWQNDAAASSVQGKWAFWSDAKIEKHVNMTRMKRGHVRAIPFDLFERLPKRLKKYKRRMMQALPAHEMGYQPDWGDYPNVRGWPLILGGEANFDDDGPFALNGIRNSMLFAVQLAHRLGYRTLLFAGCDLNGPGYQEHRNTMERWYGMARERGFRWFNLSAASALAAFVPAATREAA